MPTHHRALLPLLALALGVIAEPARAHDGDRKLVDKQPAFQGSRWRNALRRGPVSARASAGPTTTATPNPSARLALSAPAPATTTSLLASGPAIGFTSHDVTLLSWLTLPDFGVNAAGNGNSCYGYTSPSGREYALMGLSTGTAVVEITQPGEPVIVAQIPGPVSLWRDMRTYSHYAYAVSEGGGGIQVIDLANVDAGTVTLVGNVSDDAWGQTHTLAVDPVSGYLYRAGGAGQGLRMYDVHTNPAVPTRVGSWNDRYVHEPTIVSFASGPAAGKEIAYCCGGLSNGYIQSGLYVVDVTNKAAPAQLAYVNYPNSYYAHQCWPSTDKRWLYLDDELDDHYLGVTSVTRVFDLANPLAPVLASTFSNGSTAVDHNQYTRGDQLLQANYRAGLRVFTTSAPGTPTSPVESAWFDTWPEDDGTFFNSLWNVYADFPSGTVIGSDLEKGLFVWWVGAPPIAFDVPGGAPAVLAPSGDVLRVAITGSVLPGSAELHYDAGAGQVTVALAQAPNGDWIAPLPPTACGTDVRWSFSARSANGVIWSAPEGAPETCFAATVGFAETLVAAHDFESAAGWTASPAGDTAFEGQWVRGDPDGTDLQPENDHSPLGAACFYTGANPPGTVHLGDVDGGFTTLVSPAFALANRGEARIAYWRWYDNQLPTGSLPDDPFRVDVTNDGTTWVNVETIGPSDANSRGGWIHHAFRVADFVTPTNAVRVRFRAQDLNLDTHVEAAIDDVRVVDVECGGYATFCAGDGSGAACPCGNHGASGAGCTNSLGRGAQLAASGGASIANDTLVLSASEMPANGTMIFLQGDVADGAGLGLALGDGLRCVTGSVVRLGTKQNAGGAAQFPAPGDAALHVAGGATPGATRYYQAWYRNAASWCTSATFNWSNAVAVGWTP
ncbi:MAG: choice-of-anchor B family protein [Planctomycetes bacterium]|nr:choice-of-anchor B family protein [Planctomycetota bacterium]